MHWASASARASTPPGGWAARTPRSSCCSPSRGRAQTRSHASSTRSTGNAGGGDAHPVRGRCRLRATGEPGRARGGRHGLARRRGRHRGLAARREVAPLRGRDRARRGRSGGRGSGRSISAYDLHAGLGACAAHLTRFGGHPMAAGVELEAASVGAFRDALAAHAGRHLPGRSDSRRARRRDRAGRRARPRAGRGARPAAAVRHGQPAADAAFVPAARIANVAGMGEERPHARFTLVSAGIRARGVAFGATQKSLAADDARHVAVRLESNRWNGTVEPRVVLRALCPPEPHAARAGRGPAVLGPRARRVRARPGPAPPRRPPQALSPTVAAPALRASSGISSRVARACSWRSRTCRAGAPRWRPS